MPSRRTMRASLGRRQRRAGARSCRRSGGPCARRTRFASRGRRACRGATRSRASRTRRSSPGTRPRRRPPAARAPADAGRAARGRLLARSAAWATVERSPCASCDEHEQRRRRPRAHAGAARATAARRAASTGAAAARGGAAPARRAARARPGAGARSGARRRGSRATRASALRAPAPAQGAVGEPDEQDASRSDRRGSGRAVGHVASIARGHLLAGTVEPAHDRARARAQRARRLLVGQADDVDGDDRRAQRLRQLGDRRVRQRASIASSGPARSVGEPLEILGRRRRVRRRAADCACAPHVWRSTRSRYARSWSRCTKRGRRSTRSKVSCTRSSASSRDPHSAYAARSSRARWRAKRAGSRGTVTSATASTAKVESAAALDIPSAPAIGQRMSAWRPASWVRERTPSLA